MTLQESSNACTLNTKHETNTWSVSMRKIGWILFYVVYIALFAFVYVRLLQEEGIDFPEWYMVIPFIAWVVGTLVMLVRLAKAPLSVSLLAAIIVAVLFGNFILQTDVFSAGGGALLILPAIAFAGTFVALLVIRIIVRIF